MEFISWEGPVGLLVEAGPAAWTGAALNVGKFLVAGMLWIGKKMICLFHLGCCWVIRPLNHLVIS